MAQAETALNVERSRELNRLEVVLDPPPESTKQDAPTAIGTWSDSELVTAIASRHDHAFAELFRRHHASVVRSSRMILGNVTTCEDVAADVLFAFWLNPEKYDPCRGTLLSFLRVRAKGRSVDLIRAETARSRRERRDVVNVHLLDAGVDAKILEEESIARLRTALTLLPANELEPIELAFFGGMTYVAVAIHLNLPEGTVKSRIRSGLEQLRTSCLTQHRTPLRVVSTGNGAGEEWQVSSCSTKDLDAD
jgi:RNA polymerase sigma-70 factor, ECF subfamily